jgi:muramoyltetrapeptide carboxypeptidase
LETLRKALFGEELKYEYRGHTDNRIGKAADISPGGNFSLLIAALGAVLDVDVPDNLSLIPGRKISLDLSSITIKFI